MSENKTKHERQSAPVRTGALAPLTEDERARQEALNTLRQYDRMTELIDGTIADSRQFRLRPHVIQNLNRISIFRLEADAGRWRDVEMRIGQSKHVPPVWEEVPRYIDELCDYVNDNWETRTAVHLASYVMWRINWIHPFVDGNGRTTRAVAYYVLCVKMGFRIPGVKTIPELIAGNKDPYYKALEAADEKYKEGTLEVSAMEVLLKDLLANQLVEAIERPEMGYRKGSKLTVVDKSAPSSQTGASDRFNVKAGFAFGAVAVIFFMALVLLQVFGHPVPESGKYLIVILLALFGGLSTGYLGGEASARGSIPFPSAEHHPMRYGLTGGIAVFVILLVIGKYLFL